MRNIKIEAVRDCIWWNEEKTLINCQAKFSHIYTEDGDGVKTYEWMPFLANPNDVEAHGRLLYANAAKGDYGAVADFAHPSLEKELNRIRSDRNRLLEETDWTQTPDVPQATKDKFTTYRQELRDITEGIDTNTKARNVTWPTKPS